MGENWLVALLFEQQQDIFKTSPFAAHWELDEDVFATSESAYFAILDKIENIGSDIDFVTEIDAHFDASVGEMADE